MSQVEYRHSSRRARLATPRVRRRLEARFTFYESSKTTSLEKISVVHERDASSTPPPSPRSSPPARVDDVKISTLHRLSRHRELSTAASQYVFAARVDARELILFFFWSSRREVPSPSLFAVRAALGSCLRMRLRLLHRARGFLRGGDDLVDGSDGAEVLLDVLVLHAVLVNDEEAAHDESLADQV